MSRLTSVWRPAAVIVLTAGIAGCSQHEEQDNVAMNAAAAAEEHEADNAAGAGTGDKPAGSWDTQAGPAEPPANQPPPTKPRPRDR